MLTVLLELMPMVLQTTGRRSKHLNKWLLFWSKNVRRLDKTSVHNYQTDISLNNSSFRNLYWYSINRLPVSVFSQTAPNKNNCNCLISWQTPHQSLPITQPIFSHIQQQHYTICYSKSISFYLSLSLPVLILLFLSLPLFLSMQVCRHMCAFNLFISQSTLSYSRLIRLSYDSFCSDSDKPFDIRWRIRLPTIARHHHHNRSTIDILCVSWVEWRPTSMIPWLFLTINHTHSPMPIYLSLLWDNPTSVQMNNANLFSWQTTF